MGLTIKELEGGKLAVTGAGTRKTGNTLEERKVLDRLHLLELRKLGTDKRDEWFEEKYQGEKVAGPDDFKPAMGHDWGEVEAADFLDEDYRAIGIKKIRVYSPKDFEDLGRLRKPTTLNWGGMEPEIRESLIEKAEEAKKTNPAIFDNDAKFAASLAMPHGPLGDRNRKMIREDWMSPSDKVSLLRHPQFDVRGWRFDASQHQGGETTENLPWAERYRPSSHATWNKYIRPFLLDDGETLGLMWINPRMPKGLTAERVIDDYLSFNKQPNIFDRTDAVIGESSRLAKEADTKSGAAYRDDYAKARKAEGKEGTVPSAEEGPLSPEMKVQKALRIRSAVEEERRLMEEPLPKQPAITIDPQTGLPVGGGVVGKVRNLMEMKRELDRRKAAPSLPVLYRN